MIVIEVESNSAFDIHFVDQCQLDKINVTAFCSFYLAVTFFFLSFTPFNVNSR